MRISDWSSDVCSSDLQLKSLKIGAGSEGLIQGYFSDYVMTVKERVDGEMVTSEVPGLSFTLTGVQIIKLVKGGGGAEFGAYEGGGFTYEGGDSDDDDELNIGSDSADGEDEIGRESWRERVWQSCISRGSRDNRKKK